MTGIDFKRGIHRGYIIAAVSIIAVLTMVLYGLSCYNSNAAAAGVVIEPAVEEMTVDAAGEVANAGPAKYSLGSIQKDSAIKAAPGDEIDTGIDFYNVDGNLTTYITLAVAEAPEGWKIELAPGLAVEVTELLDEPVDTMEEGTKCVRLGDRGYAVAGTGAVRITVPDDIGTGTEAEIIITAKAEWYGQTGQAVIGQTRDFSYSIYVVE